MPCFSVDLSGSCTFSAQIPHVLSSPFVVVFFMCFFRVCVSGDASSHGTSLQINDKSQGFLDRYEQVHHS